MFKRLVVGLMVGLLIISIPLIVGAEKVKITYWHQWTGQWTPVLADIAKMYNEAHPDVEVKAVVVPEDFTQRLMTAITTGDVPDVVSLTGSGNLMLAEKEVLIPIDELMSPEEMQAFKDWAMPVIWEVNDYKGHIWAITPYIDVPSLYYNETMFEEAGLDPDKPPLDIKTLDEFTQKLTKYDVRGNIDRIGFYPSWGIATWGNAFGGNLVNEAGDKVVFNEDPKILAALEWITSYSEVFDVKKVVAFESGLGEERGGILDPFISERKAMEQQGQWVIINIANYAPEDFSYGITSYLPCPPDGRKNSVLTRSAYGALAIPKGSKHTKEGLDFATFWVGYKAPEERAKIFEWGAWMPLDKGQEVWNLESLQPYLEEYPQFNIFRDILFAGNWTVMKTPADSFLFDRLDSANDYARLLQKTPKQALDDAAKEVQQELDRLLAE